MAGRRAPWLLLFALGAVVTWGLLCGRPGLDASPGASPSAASPPLAEPLARPTAPADAPHPEPGGPLEPPREGAASAPIQVRVARTDGSPIAGARVRLASVELPEAYDIHGGWYGGLCFPAGVSEVVAALRRGIPAAPLGEAVTDATGLAEFRVAGNPGALHVLAEDPGSGDRGVLVERVHASMERSFLVTTFKASPPRFSITSPGGASAVAFDAERLALVELPVSAAGAVSFGAVQFGLLFVEQPGHDGRAFPFGAGTEGSLALLPLGGRVRVELSPRFASARVELSDGCRRWRQQAVGGLVTVSELPAEGIVSASLVEQGTALDPVAAGPLVRGQTTQLRLGFEPAARVRVTVVDDQGAAVPAIATVTMEASPRFARSHLEMRPPPLEVGPLPRGKATLEVTTLGYSTHHRALELDEGLNDVTVRFEPSQKRVQVTGRLTHQAGREVAPLGSNSRSVRLDDGTWERSPAGGWVEVELVADPLDEGESRLGGLEVTTKGPVGEIDGLFDRGRWRLRGSGSDGSVLREVELSVPGPPVELVLVPAPTPE